MKSGFCACAITFQTQSTGARKLFFRANGFFLKVNKWETAITAQQTVMLLIQHRPMDVV